MPDDQIQTIKIRCIFPSIATIIILCVDQAILYIDLNNFINMVIDINILLAKIQCPNLWKLKMPSVGENPKFSDSMSSSGISV